MTVRAKFAVHEKKEHIYWHSSDKEKLVTIVLNPVVDGSEENKEFYKWTPAGQIELGILSKEVGDKFELGQEFYVDFIPAEK